MRSLGIAAPTFDDDQCVGRAVAPEIAATTLLRIAGMDESSAAFVWEVDACGAF
jgi:hypothetical protein